MTKIEIIDEIIAKKQELLSKAKKKALKVRDDRRDSYFSVIQKYFGGELNTEYSSDAYILKPKYDGDSSFEILRPHEDYSYDKELGTVRIERPWSWREEKGEKPSMRISTYSTSAGGPWELERFAVLGKVASVIQDFQDDIIAEMDSITDSYKDKYDTKYKEVRTLEADIQKLRDEKNNSYLDTAEKLLESKEGLKFDGNKKGSMDLRWDWTLRGISSAKILSKTASGKSADVEISTYGETPRVFEKVRMTNVENLLWQYRDYVLTADSK